MFEFLIPIRTSGLPSVRLFGNKIISVRINGLDTHYMYRDVIDIVEKGGERLDLIMIPKVGTQQDVYAVDMLVTQTENSIGRKKKIGFEMIIETALGMQNVYEIATASKRNESLHFGIADYAASTKAKTTGIGTQNPKYSVLTDPDKTGKRNVVWNDMWYPPLSSMGIAARAAGLRPVDGPFGEIKDPDAYKSSANRAAVIGCEGKWAIHPSQIELANKIAPEHLELMVKNSKPLSKKITGAGLLLIGKNTPSAASDYLLGTNHILPTNGFGRTRGGLSFLDFNKLQTIVESKKSTLREISKSLKTLTDAEGLPNHYKAVKRRLD